MLDGDDFRAYYQQVGKDAVEAELKFANQRGYSLSDAVLDYLEDKATGVQEYRGVGGNENLSPLHPHTRINPI